MSSSSTMHAWPDALDLGATLFLFGLVLALTVAGYVFMVLDYRAYLRSLRRHLSRVFYGPQRVPQWVLRDTPPALRALGLRLPCTEEELRRAFRRKARQVHPDLGGDERRFRRVQAQFEEALEYIQRYEAAR